MMSASCVCFIAVWYLTTYTRAQFRPQRSCFFHQEYSVLWLGTPEKSGLFICRGHWSWRSWESCCVYAFEVWCRQASSCRFWSGMLTLQTFPPLCCKGPFLNLLFISSLFFYHSPWSIRIEGDNLGKWKFITF